MSNSFAVSPGLIHVNTNARNAMYPSAYLWRRLIDAENHLTAYGTMREVYSYQWELGIANVSGAGTVTLGRFRFRTNRSATSIKVLMLMGLAHNSGGAGAEIAAARMEFDATISGGATSTETFYYGQGNDGLAVDGPDDMSLLTKTITVTPSTIYECAVKSVGYARPIACCVWEQTSLNHSESVLYYNTQNPIAGYPIYDADRQLIVQGLSNMYRQGAASVNWHLNNGGTRTRSSGTPINIFDNSTTTAPATSDYGFYLNPQYRNTASRTTVPFELAAYGSIGAGAGSVRLMDSGGITYGPLTINGAAGWYTTTLSLPTASTFFAVQYYSDGVNTVTVNAVSLTEWETGP